MDFVPEESAINTLSIEVRSRRERGVGLGRQTGVRGGVGWGGDRGSVPVGPRTGSRAGRACVLRYTMGVRLGFFQLSVSLLSTRTLPV